ncbi:MAG: metallophosphoesterase [Candidatus Micrarchaeota archaeon]|nr:metallophosphoesterase [Candidatus Micrarchaeota archaeon]
MIWGEPAAIWKGWLILADIHLGGRASPGWEATAGVIRGMMLSERKKKLLILGDLKAGYTGTEPDAGRLIRSLGSEFDLHITKGNHDGNLEKYGAYCTVYGPGGGVFDGLGALHGHAWPSEELLGCSTIIMGHSHPKVVFGREFRQAEKVWVIGRLSYAGLRRHYGDGVRIRRVIEAVSMPSFCAGTPYGEGETALGPLMREDIFIRKSARIYLLNGTRIQ